MKGDLLTPETIVRVAKNSIELGYTFVKLSGEFGDPLFRNDIVEIVKGINEHRPEEISIATNGLLLKDKVEDLISNGVNKFCISLDTLDETKYKNITGKDGLKDVKEAIQLASSKLGRKVKVNMVVMKDVNYEEIDSMRIWVNSIGATFQLIELYVIPGKESFFENHC